MGDSARTESAGPDSMMCRSCRSREGELVLDLGRQPPCDYFPGADDPGPDPLYPLQMWLCSSCGLAQLVSDPTIPEEPKAAEPAALVAQAEDAVGRVGEHGLLSAARRVAEYGSPHGGSWLGLLTRRGLSPVAAGQEADVIVDCFGMMHDADQASALIERTRRVAPGGTLLLQYHSLATILRLGQWNALRHGHYAYYSTTALVSMLAANGFTARAAWQFDLYGGTVLLAAQRSTDDSIPHGGSVSVLLDEDRQAGVRDASTLRRLQGDVQERAQGLRSWLVAQRAAGSRVIGYGAASRAVSYLRWAGVDRELLPAVADISPAKHGRRMPGTDIPIIDPEELIASQPDAVALFLPDLLDEVRRKLPEIEASGAAWVDVDGLLQQPAPSSRFIAHAPPLPTANRDRLHHLSHPLHHVSDPGPSSSS